MYTLKLRGLEWTMEWTDEWTDGMEYQLTKTYVYQYVMYNL